MQKQRVHWEMRGSLLEKVETLDEIGGRIKENGTISKSTGDLLSTSNPGGGTAELRKSNLRTKNKTKKKKKRGAKKKGIIEHFLPTKNKF